jgi:hypothetical protein
MICVGGQNEVVDPTDHSNLVEAIAYDFDNSKKSWKDKKILSSRHTMCL